MPADIKLGILKRLVGKYTERRRKTSARNRSRGLLRWMRQNPALVAQRNRNATAAITHEDRRALGRLTWAGTTHAERSKEASSRQRRRWRKVPKRERSEYMSALNRLRWASVPKAVRSKLLSQVQKGAWAKLSPRERSGDSGAGSHNATQKRRR